MFYLIDRGVVAQLAAAPFDIAVSPDLYWVAAPDNIAVVGDKYINSQFEPRYNLDERRNIQLATLENVFVLQIGSGVTLNEKTFFSDSDSRNLISQSLASEDRGIPVFPTIWFLKDMDPAEVTYDEMKNVSALLVDKVKGCYYNREALRQQIMGSPNPESVDLNVGWPV